MQTPDPLVAPPIGRGVFCNRTLNLRSVRAIGYDMDYTLVHYEGEAWERRAYAHVRRKLGERGWPVEDLAFDPRMVIRGLIIDRDLGNLVKANRFGYVKQASHGTRPMEFDAQRKAYARTEVDLADPRWLFLNALFSLSEAVMYAQLVDRLDEGRAPQVVGYRELHAIVRASLDEAHLEGELKAEILADPNAYVSLDPNTARALRDQRAAGKKLLLITNADWPYTHTMMSYAFDRFLPPRQTWRELFDLVIVSARKPDFFDRPAPVYEVVSDDGLLRPCPTGIVRDGVYAGGHAGMVETYLGLDSTDFLFVGDHVYADVYVSKRVRRWRTALILRELEDELAALERFGDEQARLKSLMAEKSALEAQHAAARLAQLRARERKGADSELVAEIDRLRGALAVLDETIAPLARAGGELHSARWGLLMRTGNDKSHLAYQMERHADIYTSRVSNFLFATPFAYFRSSRGSLPHDPG